MNKLFVRILFSFFLLIILTLGLMFSLSSRQVRISSTEILTELTEQIVAARAGEISSWIDQRFSELSVFIESDRFQALGPGDRFSELQAFGQRHKGDYESVGLLQGEGRVLLSDGSMIDISERRYYQRFIDEDLDRVVSRPIISRSDQSPIVVLLCRRDDVLVSGAILLSWLSDIAAKIEVKGQKAWIVDREGYIVAHPDKGLRMLLSSPEGDGSEESIRIKEAIPNTPDWFLAVDIPRSLLFQDVQRMIGRLLFLAFLMALLASLLAVYLASSLAKPIRHLQGLMFRAERGDLQVRASALRGDEIGRLERSFNSMMERLQLLMEQSRWQQSELRRKELETMMGQIKPHFLYNTLDSIRWMALEQNAQGAAEMLSSLSHLFRLSLSGGEELIPLRDELSHVKTYLHLQQIRFEDRFSFSVEDGGLADALVLKLILQPLAENALYHGRPTGGKSGEIRIVCRPFGPDIEMLVYDNGPGLSADLITAWSEGAYKGYGMRNVDERLKLRFGPSYGLFLVDDEETRGGGALLRIRHPRIRSKERGDSIDEPADR